MAAYEPQEWKDEDATLPGSAVRFLHIESGLNSAASWGAEEDNHALGRGAMANLPVGSGNTALGVQSMEQGGGAENTAVGMNSMSAAGATTSRNAVLGAKALREAGGTDNAVLGWSAMGEETAGSRNAVVGADALSQSKRAENNAVLGYRAGCESTFSGQVLLGFEAGSEATENTGYDNRLFIGHGAKGALIEGTLTGTQLLAFYGATPVPRAAAITSPGESLASLKNAVDKIREVLKASTGLGLTA